MDHNTSANLIKAYGSPLYVFNEWGFQENYRRLEQCFRQYYSKYQISYSFKTNYTPYIASTVKHLGGYAEVVSGMEYHIAKRIGYQDDKIIFNGPNKGKDGRNAFLSGCILNADSLQEVEELCSLAAENGERSFEMGVRVNLDIGQDFVSRFGMDLKDLDLAFSLVRKVPNLKIGGLHCHISRCRGLSAWQKRTEFMLSLADQYFEKAPKYIDLGSGMFGDMAPEFAAQFSDVPSYEDYARVTARLVADHYESSALKPMLFTEPGTTLVNRYVDFIATVDVMKEIRGETFAVLDCSEHNLGETCTLKELPVKVIHNGPGKYCSHLHLVGYTCLEQDIMRKNLQCEIAVGDNVVFGNVGGYSNVLKPPFIWPNCRMVTYNTQTGYSGIIKEAESYADVLHTYVF